MTLQNLRCLCFLLGGTNHTLDEITLERNLFEACRATLNRSVKVLHPLGHLYLMYSVTGPLRSTWPFSQKAGQKVNTSTEEFPILMSLPCVQQINDERLGKAQEAYRLLSS